MPVLDWLVLADPSMSCIILQATVESKGNTNGSRERQFERHVISIVNFGFQISYFYSRVIFNRI